MILAKRLPSILGGLILTTGLSGLGLGQYVSIETNSDTLGLCGAPGNRGCDRLPTCTQPSDNWLRIDGLKSSILCDRAQVGPLLNPGTVALQGLKLGATDATFYAVTDLHFGKPTFTDADHLRHVTEINTFATSGTHWPQGAGLPDVPVAPPLGIVLTGDIAHDGASLELGAYRLLWENGVLPESIRYPVFFGLGNHDADASCSPNNNCAQGMMNYDTLSMGGGATNLDITSGNYSWDWKGVHFVQLNTWANDSNLGYSTHPGGMVWLLFDLSVKVGKSGRPVVIFQHFGYDTFSIMNLGVDETGPASTVWWNAENRNDFWNIIRDYNVIGMFSGHQHASGAYAYQDINSAGQTKRLDDFVGGTGGENGVGDFYAARVTDDYLDVAPVQWSNSQSKSGTYFPPSLDDPQFPFPATNGCRKRINTQFVDISAAVPAKVNQKVVTVTNNTSAPIQGPIAIGTKSSLTNLSFVDSCATYMYDKNANREQLTTNSYMLLDLSTQGGQLGPGKSMSVTLTGSYPSSFETVQLVSLPH